MPIGTGGVDLSAQWVRGTPSILGPQAGENTYRWATVTDDSPLEIRLDGDVDPLPMVPESLIEAGPPAIGARVWVQLFGRRVIVLGVSGGLTDPVLTALIATVTAQGGQISAAAAQLGLLPAQILTGTVAVTISIGNGAGSQTVTFPGGGFASMPRVALTPVSASRYWLAATSVVTATDFLATVGRPDGANVGSTTVINCDWIAVQM